MTNEKLFELAVSLVAANIAAGQHNNNENFATIVHDDTQTAFDRLEKLWCQISGDIDEGSPDEPIGDVSH